jgi:hypothetical protein
MAFGRDRGYRLGRRRPAEVMAPFVPDPLRSRLPRARRDSSGAPFPATDPTTDFVAAGQGGADEIPGALRGALDRLALRWQLGEWAPGQVAPRCWRTLVPARGAIESWNRLRSLADETGCWPVVIGGPDDEVAHAAALRESLDSTDALVRDGLVLDVDEWLTDEAAIDPDLVREVDDGSPFGSARVITHRILDAPPWRLRRAGNGTLLWVEIAALVGRAGDPALRWLELVPTDRGSRGHAASLAPAMGAPSWWGCRATGSRWPWPGSREPVPRRWRWRASTSSIARSWCSPSTARSGRWPRRCW